MFIRREFVQQDSFEIDQTLMNSTDKTCLIYNTILYNVNTLFGSIFSKYTENQPIILLNDTVIMPC